MALRKGPDAAIANAAIPLSFLGSTPVGVSAINSNSTYINSAGVIITAANAPRIDFAPKTLAPRGLLTEPARTNLNPLNNAIANGATWALQNTGTGTAGTAPDGGAMVLIRDGTSSGSTTYNNYLQPVARPTLTSGTTYTWSAFVKQAPSNPASWLCVPFMLGNCYFNLATGAPGTAFSGSTLASEDWGNGLYRISVTQTSVSTIAYTCNFGAVLADAGSQTRAGTVGLNGFYIWGIQVETGSRATSVIPNNTTGSISTTADAVITTTLTGFQNYIGSIYVEGQTAYTTRTAAETIVSFNDNSVNNRLSFRAATTASFNFVDDSGGVSQLNATEGVLVANSVFKLAQTYQKNGSIFEAVNGIITGNTGPYTAPSGISQVQFGIESGGTVFNGWIRSINWYNVGLTSQQLQQITT